MYGQFISSKLAVKYIEEQESGTNIKCIAFNDIPVNWSNASRIDFFNFGLSKWALEKIELLNRHWKMLQEEKNCKTGNFHFGNFSNQLRAIVRDHGYHIENKSLQEMRQLLLKLYYQNRSRKVRVFFILNIKKKKYIYFIYTGCDINSRSF